MPEKTNSKPLWSGFGAIVTVAYLACAAIAAPAYAVPITGLFNTGVDATGNALAGGASDPHYSILVPDQAAIVIQDASIPGVWLANTSTRRWVWQNATGGPDTATLTFQTTFDLSGLDPTTASLAGQWATDNSGLNIFINGVGTGNTCGGFSSLCNFAVSSGFVAGINTLDFLVQNTGGPGGFLVSSISGTADALQNGGIPVPEPGMLALFGFGLAGLGFARRRKLHS